MDRRGRNRDRVPCDGDSDVDRFVRALLGLPEPPKAAPAVESRAERDLREFLEDITETSPYEQRRRELRAKLSPRPTSTRPKHYPVWPPLQKYLDDYAAQCDEAWDPAKHPRTGTDPNAGWFASTGGGASGSTGRSSAPWPGPSSHERREPHNGSGDIGRPSTPSGRQHDSALGHQSGSADGGGEPKPRTELAQLPDKPPAQQAGPAAGPKPKTFDPEALERAGIVVKNDPGQPAINKATGDAEWNVPWDTTVEKDKRPSGDSGWIIQHVKVDVDARDKYGNEVLKKTRDADGNQKYPRPPVRGEKATSNAKDEYLEAWRVDSDLGFGKGGKVRRGEDSKNPGGDQFVIAKEPDGTYGRVIVHGKVKYVPANKRLPDFKNGNWNRPAKGGHRKDPTGELPSTRDPNEIAKFDAEPDAADHWQVYEWDTTHPDPKQHKHVTYGGLGVPPPNLPRIQPRRPAEN